MLIYFCFKSKLLDYMNLIIKNLCLKLVEGIPQINYYEIKKNNKQKKRVKNLFDQ